MSLSLRRFAPQPAIAFLCCTFAAALVFGYASAGLHEFEHEPLKFEILGPLLAVATAASFRYPIHLRHNVKLYMATVPMFIIAVCEPPIPAVIFAAAGWLGGELIARKSSGAYVSDICTNVARYAVVVMLVSITVESEWITNFSLRLLAGAVVYFLLDAITLPLLICPISGEPPYRVVYSFIRDAGIAEAAQFVLAILGGLLVQKYPWALLLLLLPATLVYTSLKDAKEMHETTLRMLESMADTVDLRDPYTGGHSRRVADYTERIMRQLGKSGEELSLVVSAARVHDIGKIGLPDSVLLKDGHLTDEETAAMQTHPDTGAQLLRRYREFARGIEVVRHHHERWDGAGYPTQLKGLAIPFGARIVAVADSFDAMTSDRPYRKGMSVESATRILVEGRDTQWWAEAVDAFLEIVDSIPALRSEESVVEETPLFITQLAA